LLVLVAGPHDVAASGDVWSHDRIPIADRILERILDQLDDAALGRVRH
jgi:hypothetical protein